MLLRQRKRIFQFNGGDDLLATWKSGEIVLPGYTGFAIADAVCDGDWTIRFFADGVERYSKDIAGGEQFRLPSGGRSQRWHIQIEGSGRFRELRIAQSARELAAI